MHRLRTVIAGTFVGAALGACGLGPPVPGPVDPACESQADPADCQAALETAVSEVGVSLEGYTVTVGTIDCGGGRCTAWVSAVPNDVDDDCVPSWDVEVARPAIGTWSVSSITHGDPPCAFEP